jgi:hypothetical protein
VPRVAKCQPVNRGQDIDPIRGHTDLKDEAGALQVSGLELVQRSAECPEGGIGPCRIVGVRLEPDVEVPRKAGLP